MWSMVLPLYWQLGDNEQKQYKKYEQPLRESTEKAFMQNVTQIASQTGELVIEI